MPTVGRVGVVGAIPFGAKPRTVQTANRNLVNRALQKKTQIQNVMVAGADATGRYSVAAASRGVVRTNLGVMGSTQIRTGDNAVVLGSGGAKDMPMILGQSPWITGGIPAPQPTP